MTPPSDFMSRMWDVYDDLGKRFGYIELYDLRDLIEELEDMI